MRDPNTFALCIEALYRGGQPHMVEAGAWLRAREMRALITAHEITGKGERKFVVGR